VACQRLLVLPALPCYNGRLWQETESWGKELRVMAAATDRISAHEVKLLLVFRQQPNRWLA
jgi:hypothetical protein